MKEIDEEIQMLKEKYKHLQLGTKEDKNLQRFDDLPLSKKTLMGLKDSLFENPTEIQKESIVPALLGRDIVAAAVTGSGKTLAFLIPVLEHLYINKWSRTDGLGVIIISPTRELAYQIFEMLKKIGKYHDFSAGLVIGGKNLRFEKKRMDQCNILICTPGRLLQHMDENPLFDSNNMQILVIDEADRCLDMGFEKSLNAIIENLPLTRQTLLFSATQNCDAEVFQRLSLQNPVLTGISASTKQLAVPQLLQQSYVVVELKDKITMIWSFIKNHLKQKIIVFLTSCKQVKYIHEIFCKLRPGISVLALYGTLSQDRRINIYNDFLNKRHVVLFATDIASRGLDFPFVNWVVQLDCPEDVTQYVHRAGRSARNKAHGESLLVLLPSEEDAMVEQLNERNIEIKKIEIDAKKLFSPHAKIEALCAQNPELKASAQRAFISYMKSIFLMKNKTVFKVHELDGDLFAKSLGLLITPRVRFLERFNKKIVSSSANYSFNHLNKADESDDDDLFTVKRKDHEISLENNEDLEQKTKKKVLTRAALAKRVIKKNIQANQRSLFDEEGTKVRGENQSKIFNFSNDKEINGIDLQISKEILAEEDKLDKERFKRLVKTKHRKLKEKLKKRKLSNSEDDDCFSENELLNSVNLPNTEKRIEKEKEKIKLNRQVSTLEKGKQPKKQKRILTLTDAEAIASELLALS